MIRLSRDVEVSKNKLNIKTVCLPTKEFQQIDSLNSELKRLTVAGWGITEDNTDSMSDVLMSATLPYLPQESCVNEYEEKKKDHRLIKINIHETQMCAGGVDRTDS